MILQALYHYYEILQNDPDLDIPRPGYCNAPISHALNLSPEGDLLNIIPLYVPTQIGKKIIEQPRRMVVPEQVKRAVNVAANFLWDNPAYVLGITNRKAKDPEYAQKRFKNFRELNTRILKQANTPSAKAVISFLQKHDPQTICQQAEIARNLEELYKGGNLIFQVEGKNVLEDPEIRRVWEDHVTAQEGRKLQCLVTGENETVARLHPDIKGVRDAQSKGASLVSFNLDAFESYGKKQGSNSPVSQRAASGYGIALNYLLSSQNPNRKIYLGDTTVVYWAESTDKQYASAFYSLLNPEYLQPETRETNNRKESEKMLGAVAEKVEQVKPINITALRENFDEKTRFYVLGLASNAARLAIRFFINEPFGVFAERIMQHYCDLEIEKEYLNQPTYISPYRIISECISTKVTRRDDELKSSFSLLGGALIRSILTGAAYPESFYAAMIDRIRHDNDEAEESGRKRNTKINYTRASYIKAHLLRKYRQIELNPYQEVLQMSLNESYTQPAYVLGRLFAALEKAQKDALGANINATIKDRYFTSACASPASVFPTLLRLSHHHIGKAEYGNVSDKRIQELLNLLEAKPFPPRLTLDEQGVFILGYYHQRNAFYTKKAESAEEIVEQ